MARGNSLYGKYLSAGKARGGYTSSWYAQKGLEAEKGAESLLGDMRQRKLDETVGAIGEGITLASNIYEGYKSKKEMDRMVKPVGEGGLGAVEQKQSTLDWIFGAEKEYKLEGEGEKIYKASDVRAKFQTSLYDEANGSAGTDQSSHYQPIVGDPTFIGPSQEKSESKINIKSASGKATTTDPMPSKETTVVESGEVGAKYSRSKKQNQWLKVMMGQDFEKRENETEDQWKERRKSKYEEIHGFQGIE
jgi:hypothetical protein